MTDNRLQSIEVNEEPTWEDIAIIADTPLTKEFADYVFDEKYADCYKDSVKTRNYHPDDPKCKAYLDAIVKEGWDWKVYDLVSLAFLRIKLKDGRVIWGYAQYKMFPTDSTPVVRFQKLVEPSPRYYQLIIQLDPLSPKVLSRDENLSDELVDELSEWVKRHHAPLFAHWMNEIDSHELWRKIEKIGD